MSEVEAVTPILQAYLKPRRARFAAKNKIDPNEIDVINEPSINEVFKEWKRENQIRTRIYKNLTPEQQQSWIKYFDEHKNLTLQTRITDDNNPPKHSVAAHPKHNTASSANDDNTPPKHSVAAHPKHSTASSATDDNSPPKRHRTHKSHA